MQDQRRYIELPEVLGEIGFGERFDAFISIHETDLHAPEPELIQNPLGDLGARPVCTIKQRCEVQVVLRAILEEASPYTVEHLDGQTLRIGRRLYHDWRDGADKDSLGHPLRPVPSDIASDLASSGGMSDQRDVPQIERIDH